MKLIIALILAAGMAYAQTTVNITNSLIGPVTQNFTNTQVNVTTAVITGAVVSASVTNSFAPVNNITNDINVGGATINNVVTNVIQTTITNDIDVAGVVVTNVTEAAVNIYNTTQVITSGVSSVNSATGAVTLTVQNTTNSAGVASWSGTVLSIGTNIPASSSGSDSNAFRLIYETDWADGANSYTYVFTQGLKRIVIDADARTYTGFGVKTNAGGPYLLRAQINGVTNQYDSFSAYSTTTHSQPFNEATTETFYNLSGFEFFQFPRTNNTGAKWGKGTTTINIGGGTAASIFRYSSYSPGLATHLQASGNAFIDYTNAVFVSANLEQATQMVLIISSGVGVTTGLTTRIYGAP